MKKVCVITGGGSGMGLATAELLAEKYYVILVGRTASKLQRAVDDLQAKGYEAEAFSCDVADRGSVAELARHAAETGEVCAVIHAAGMSPSMGTGDQILRTNALGTIYMNEEFLKVMGKDACMIDVSSMSAYMAPGMLVPKKAYALAFTDPEKCVKKIDARAKLFGKKMYSALAYVLSKNFVIWYAKKCANAFGAKGARILSVTPGNFDTPMGNLEKDAGGGAFVEKCAIKRFGEPQEIALLFADLVDPRLGYLTGTDIVMDGGVVGNMEK